MPVLKQMYARNHETQPTPSIEDLRRVEILNDSELDSSIGGFQPTRSRDPKDTLMDSQVRNLQ